MLPKDQTLLGATFSYRLFSSEFEGSNAVDNNAAKALELFMTTFDVRHYFGEGLSANISLPAGHLRYDREDDLLRLSGIGDINLGLRYNFAGIWGTGGYLPSLSFHLGLGLPTGDSLEDEGITGSSTTSTELAPVSLLSLGLGVFSANAELEYTQFIHRAVALTVKGTIKLPLTPNNAGITMAPESAILLGFLPCPPRTCFWGRIWTGAT